MKGPGGSGALEYGCVLVWVVDANMNGSGEGGALESEGARLEVPDGGKLSVGSDDTVDKSCMVG